MPSPKRIDINADVGEGCGFDAALMPWITSANVAAGYHAGSPEILRDTIHLAALHGVKVGAHPGFRDREHFGRREFPISPQEARTLVSEQIAIVAAAASAERTPLHHVKPHGALYNMAARHRELADAIVAAIAAHDASLMLYAPSHSALYAAGQAARLRVAGEVFADRAYAADGSLAPRSQAGAVIEDIETAVARAIRMVGEGSVVAIDGSIVRLQVDTICVHGDSPGCDVLAARLREALQRL